MKFTANSLASIGIALASGVLAFAPIPGLASKIIIVGGTEIQAPLEAIAAKFSQENPNVQIELKFQGSQELANRYLDGKFDFKPTILMPANAEIVKELGDRFRTQNNSEAFYDAPKPIAKTMLVAVAWSDRGKVLFPDGKFQWSQIERAMQAGKWSALGGQSQWGSFDFVATDPTRSNSGQLTLALWAQSKAGGTLNAANLNQPAIADLFGLVKRSIYEPARSTDILLQEFIARGPNDADVATTYESLALNRWQQSATSQGKAYQIYYLNPTIETVSTAAIARKDVDDSTAGVARQFLEFATQPNQQQIFVQYGFRPIASIDLKSVPNSPWSQNIPGVETNPTSQIIPAPNPEILNEVKRNWERAK
jgi:Bacterial extracellular solute-binding protein